MIAFTFRILIFCVGGGNLSKFFDIVDFIKTQQKQN